MVTGWNVFWSMLAFYVQFLGGANCFYRPYLVSLGRGMDIISGVSPYGGGGADMKLFHTDSHVALVCGRADL